MTEVVGVKFKSEGRMYYFDPSDEKFAVGDYVIVETARGIECGRINADNRMVDDSEVVQPLKKIIKKADDKDIKRVEENHKKEKVAFGICEKKIAEHKLEMKLVDVEYAFDCSKILFYFTADGRVDFRELVKSLAAEFHTRIELRQIGVRDEAKMLGGLGICGQPFCCNRFLGDFQPVSIKMAKEQGLSLNPTKISGSCGRLMCCLKYEQEAYEYLNSMTPRTGSTVRTSEGNATVLEANPLSGMLQVRVGDDGIPFSVHRDDVTMIRHARPKKERKNENDQ